MTLFFHPSPPIRGSRINTSHPLARGLTLAYVFSEKGGGVVWDHINRYKATLAGGAFWKEGGVAFESDYDRLDGIDCPDVLFPTGTIVIGYRYTTAPGSYYYWVLAADDYDNFGINGSVGTSQVQFHIGGTYAYESSLDFYDGDPHACFFLWDDDSNLREAYCDEALQFSDTTTAFTWPDLSGKVFRIGGRSDTTARFLGGIVWYVYVYDRLLSKGERQQIIQNPYSIIAPPSQIARLFYLAGGGSSYYQSVYGNMPNPSGSIIKKISIAHTGNVPAPSGNIIKKISTSVAGNMPAPSGTLGTILVFLKSLAGNMPAPSGSLSMIRGFHRTLSGVMGTILGSVTKKIGKKTSGVAGAISGGAAKKTSKKIAGDIPTATGNLGTAFSIKQGTTGIMGTISGVLNTIKNPIIIIRETFKILGSNLKRFIQ